MTFGILDHVFVALVAITAPLSGLWAYRRMTASLAAGDARARARGYRRAIWLELDGAVVILLLWAVSGRPGGALLSLAWLPDGWWTGAALRGNETGLAAARKQMTSVEGLLPHTANELKLFLAVSLAAGVGEEIVYRGYLLPYFDGLVGPAGAVLASSLMFGVGHAYQGAAGIVRTGIVGLLYAGAYVATDNLLAPMLLHVVIDATSGTLAYLALRPVTAVGGQPA